MIKKYFNISGKKVPFIYGGMPSRTLDTNLPLTRDAIPADRDTNKITSTDYFYGVIAYGEGPIYKINPNGPQDVEFNDSSLDDLINLDGDGQFSNSKVATFYSLGNANAVGVPREFNSYFSRVVSPQSLSSAIVLRYGNISGIPKVEITQRTSSFDWDGLEFSFTIGSLFTINESDGSYLARTTSIKITLKDSLGNDLVFDGNPKTQSYSAVIQTPTKVVVKFLIPADKKDENGYQFTIEKTSEDTDSTRVSEQIAFNGWDEVAFDDLWYTRTALMGIVLRSYAEYSGSVPTITSLVKGLLVKVPSNYVQPVLATGEIDWRFLEVAETGELGYTQRGYYLENYYNNTTPLKEANPVLYKGVWDGTFVKKWTQNPAWIVYDLLTNREYGLGIPEEHVDKFKFYKVAQYCDAVDPATGRFTGIDGYADGTFRHKPYGYTRQKIINVTDQASVIKILNRENQIGLPAGTKIKERRFICNISINAQKQVIDVINQVTSIFRGILIYSSGKISLNVDLPDELPVAVFNETNILKDSLQISGIKESDIVTGVEVSYMDPTNHYKREVVRVDDPRTLEELSFIENVKQVDLVGCDRRSQAMRFAQYLLSASKFSRRRASFKTSTEALNLSVGDVISLSQRMIGVSWGYGGRVSANSTIGSCNVLLEHFTSPSIPATTFTANTYPVGLRIINRQSDKVGLYLVNTAYTISSGNAVSGIDLIELGVNNRFNVQTRVFESITTIPESDRPLKGDIWTLGEVNPISYATSTTDKLFKIVSIERDSDEQVQITASEYIANVYVSSDSLQNYTPVRFPKPISPLITPPTPSISAISEPVVGSDGKVMYNIRLNPSTDISNYPYGLKLDVMLAAPEDAVEVQEIS